MITQEQKKMEIMKYLDEEFGDTKSYEWKVSICHFVIYYDNMAEGGDLVDG